jgi:hypothetical protein
MANNTTQEKSRDYVRTFARDSNQMWFEGEHPPAHPGIQFDGSNSLFKDGSQRR